MTISRSELRFRNCWHRGASSSKDYSEGALLFVSHDRYFIDQILKNRDVLCSESSLFRYLRDAGIQPKKTSQHRAKSRRRGEDSAQPARPDHPGDGTTLAEQPGVAHSVSEGEASTAPAENGEPSANRSQSTAMPLPPRPADATRDRVRKRGPRIAQIKLLDDSES